MQQYGREMGKGEVNICELNIGRDGGGMGQVMDEGWGKADSLKMSPASKHVGRAVQIC